MVCAIHLQPFRVYKGSISRKVCDRLQWQRFSPTVWGSHFRLQKTTGHTQLATGNSGRVLWTQPLPSHAIPPATVWTVQRFSPFPSHAKPILIPGKPHQLTTLTPSLALELQSIAGRSAMTPTSTLWQSLRECAGFEGKPGQGMGLMRQPLPTVQKPTWRWPLLLLPSVYTGPQFSSCFIWGFRDVVLQAKNWV